MKTYAIRWTSTVAGGTGIGTKLFDLEDAEHLASELNENYPDISHEAIIPPPPRAEVIEAQTVEPLSD